MRPKTIILALLVFFIAPCKAFEFVALSASAVPEFQPENKPFVMPEDYDQEIVSDENTQNIYPDSDWFDMLTLNETAQMQVAFFSHSRGTPGFFQVKLSGCFRQCH